MLENNQNKNLLLIKDLGMKFPNKNSKQKFRYGLYKCFCGKEFETQISTVKRQVTKSCGCVRIRHNLSNHRLYGIWNMMNHRCINVKNKYYCNYGDKGIKVCDEWKNDFKAFYDWAINNGYKDDLTLDRKDNNGNYCPNNCRFVNRTIQQRNTRKLYSHNTSGYRGVTFDKKANKWRTQIIISGEIIYLGYFDNPIDGAKTYDKYVIDNNLEHTINGVCR